MHDDQHAHLADDGDAIPRAPRQANGAPCISMAMLGACPQCQTRQWYLEVTRHPGGESNMGVQPTYV
ncbi:hypothetical protein BI317_25945 (plasmid) [Xanthomonas hortorum pv. gardneri]|nr:hypothetical protein BI317_25945 [Xanthomonas hortorum pv. gardneri]NMI33245.1 hypothetical protein [Xanthomonas hortorum pv. vitians]